MVTIDSKETSFKDFQYFKLSDDASAMTTEKAVSTFTKSTLTENIGAISVVNSGTSSAPVLNFYLDRTKDPGGNGVTSVDVTLKFDPYRQAIVRLAMQMAFLELLMALLPSQQ